MNPTHRDVKNRCCGCYLCYRIENKLVFGVTPGNACCHRVTSKAQKPSWVTQATPPKKPMLPSKVPKIQWDNTGNTSNTQKRNHYAAPEGDDVIVGLKNCRQEHHPVRRLLRDVVDAKEQKKSERIAPGFGSHVNRTRRRRGGAARRQRLPSCMATFRTGSRNQGLP